VRLFGRMTGQPQFAFPIFDAAAKDLRKKGWTVISPAELDDPKVRKRCLASPDGDPSTTHKKETWGDFLSRDVKLIADEGIETIICLPRWFKSEGGRVEVFMASLPHLGLPVLKYPNLRPVTKDEYAKAYRFLLHRAGAIKCPT